MTVIARAPVRCLLLVLGISGLFAAAVLVNGNWVYNALFDADCYLGIGYAFPESIGAMNEHSYGKDRLAMTLPIALAYRLLPPEAANLALDYLSFLLAGLAFFGICRMLTSVPGALLATVAFLLNAQILAPLGADYSTGYCIVYGLLALLFLLKADTAPERTSLWLASGAFFGLMVHSNIYMLVCGLPATIFLAFRHANTRQPATAAAALYLALGAIGLTAVLATINFAFFGEWLFFSRSLYYLTPGAFDTILEHNPFKPAENDWIFTSTHTTALFFLVAAVAAWILNTRLDRDAEGGWRHRAVVAMFLAIVALVVFMHFALNQTVLHAPFYLRMILPLGWLCVALLTWRTVELLPRPVLAGLLIAFAAAHFWVLDTMHYQRYLTRPLGDVVLDYSVVFLVPSLLALVVWVVFSRNIAVRTAALVVALLWTAFVTPAHQFSDRKPSRGEMFAFNVSAMDFLDEVDPKREFAFTFDSSDPQAHQLRYMGRCPLMYYNRQMSAGLLEQTAVPPHALARGLVFVATGPDRFETELAGAKLPPVPAERLRARSFEVGPGMLYFDVVLPAPIPRERNMPAPDRASQGR